MKPAVPRWFYASDVPKRDDRPYSIKKEHESKQPSRWEAFSDVESNLLELEFQRSRGKVAVLEDKMFEVDLSAMELEPVYWKGLVYQVRRGTWFAQDGNSFYPVDENLSNQAEDGFQKFKPWKSQEKLDEPDKEFRWALFGPYMNQYIVYVNGSTAFLLQNFITSKVAQTIMAAFTKGEHLGGIKLVRGWSEVVRLTKTQINDALKAENELPEAESMETLIPSQDEYFGKREIKHLIFAIHGVGQKLGSKTESVNFIHDCNSLRKILKENSVSLKIDGAPEGGGIQVLPIFWRHNLQFDLSKESEPTLEDITLEGVPSIRTLVSDVVVDGNTCVTIVLLYQTLRYRHEMILSVASEMNSTFAEFMKRNPKFNGTIHIYAHSLGSLIAFDILCHQDVAQEPVSPTLSTEIDLSDMMTRLLFGKTMPAESRQFVYPKLNFPVNKLFLVGSPVGLFMLLQGEKLSKEPIQGAVYPKVESLYNIFHPHDPVCFRLEPMHKKELASLKPVLIPYTKGGLTGTLVGIQDMSFELVDRGKSMIETVRSGLSSAVNIVSSTCEKPPQKLSVTTQAEDIVRFDYCIQEGVLENPYISALGVHMNYWHDQDASVFIIKELYEVAKLPTGEVKVSPRKK